MSALDWEEGGKVGRKKIAGFQSWICSFLAKIVQVPISFMGNYWPPKLEK